MAVDRGYGSGFNNTGMAKPSTPRARRARGSAKPATPLSKMSTKEYNARLTQGQGARRVQQRRNDISGNMLEAFTGFNKKDGVDAGDFAGLAISIPTGGLSGIARAVGRAVVPKAARIAGAATRVAKTAYKVEPSRFADAAAKSAIHRRSLDGVSDAGSQAYSDYLKMERRLGSGATDMLLGSEGKYIQRAKDSSYKIADAAGEKAIRARELASRAARRTDASEAADEIKRRLSALQRAKRNR